MIEPVVILGLNPEGVSGLGRVATSAVRDAHFVAGGRRHLRLLGPTDAETFAVTDNLDDLVRRLERRAPGERCVVLASGDPLFFGIGQRIIAALGRESVRVESALSSMQLAFARVGLSWNDAAIASVHGRLLKPTLLPLLGRAKIGLFTRDGASPAEVARFYIDREIQDYDAWVCEGLNSPEESVIACTLPDLVNRRFHDLNVLILSRRTSTPRVPLETLDEAFARPASGPVLLTHGDLRAIVIRRFRGVGEGAIWDIGAGLGGVSVELAREFPGREIVAFERAPSRLDYLKTNRARFETFNVRVVEGEVPGCVAGEEPPAGIFLGGSGGELGPILSLIAEQLRPGGRFVANFVVLENLAYVLDRLRTLGWRSGLTEVHVSEGKPLAGLTTLVPIRPVWVVHAEKT